MRARAIETQCYIAAAAQVGRHNARRESYGNAMIVDAWGTVVARCPETTRPCIAIAQVDSVCIFGHVCECLLGITRAY